MLRLPMFLAIFIVTSAVYSYAGDVQIPVGCEDKSYCTEKPKNYDTELKRVTNLHMYKNVNKGETVHPDRPIIVGPDKNNCGYIKQVRKPFIVRARRNITAPVTHNYLIQTTDYVQTIVATECLDEGSDCFEDVVDMELRLIAKCTTKSTWIKMAILENGELIQQEVDHPIGCSCSIRFAEDQDNK